MKGLKKIPSPHDLAKVYHRLQSEKLTGRYLISIFQWSRFDPRLGEILVAKIIQDWQQINPFYLYCHLIKTTWPSAMGVLLDMAQLQIKTQHLAAYKAWKTCAQAGLKKASQEQFFIGLYAFAGTEAKKQVSNTNQIYQRWGYFGTNLLFNKEKNLKIQKTLLKKKDRLKVLEDLLQEKSVISVSDYLQALPAPVSRRVAELDLQKHVDLRSNGNTQGKVYRHQHT